MPLSRRHTSLAAGVMTTATIPSLLALSSEQLGGELFEVSFCQTHGFHRIGPLNSGPYNVVTLGTDTSGNTINTTTEIDFVSGAYSTVAHREEILEIACDRRLEVIHSNQREDGFNDMAGTGIDVWPQPSLTARLVTMLYHRWLAKAGPITLLCWELIQDNGPKMKKKLIRMAKKMCLQDTFIHWLEGPEVWCPRNVQNIICVKATAKDHPDVSGPLATVMEPIPKFGIAIEQHPHGLQPFEVEHENVLYLPGEDVNRIYRTKNWLLNKLHVCLVARWVAEGLDFETVVEAMSHPGLEEWLMAIGEETIKLHKGELVDAEEFLTDVIRRFKNEWLAHKLGDIAGGIETKWGVRCMPTVEKIGSGRKSAPTLKAVHEQHLENVSEGRYTKFQK